MGKEKKSGREKDLDRRRLDIKREQLGENQKEQQREKEKGRKCMGRER